MDDYKINKYVIINKIKNISFILEVIGMFFFIV